jgi:hypothetical protein
MRNPPNSSPRSLAPPKWLALLLDALCWCRYQRNAVKMPNAVASAGMEEHKW